MDIQSSFFALYETILSIGFGLLTVFIVIKVMERFMLHTPTSEAIKQGNTAVGIFCGALVVCVLLLVQPSILSSVNALRTMALSHNGVEPHMVWVALGYFLAFYTIAILLSLAVILLTLWLYMKSTRHVDELKELKQNNVALAVLFSLTLVGITLFVRPSTDRLIHSLVSYDRLASTERTELEETWRLWDQNQPSPDSPDQE